MTAVCGSGDETIWTVPERLLKQSRGSVGRPDAVKILHHRVVDHERDTDVQADPTESRNCAFVEPVKAFI